MLESITTNRPAPAGHKGGEMKSQKSKPKVKLIGCDGNAFAIMGNVKRALAKAGYSQEEVQRYFEEATAGDYDHLLQVTMNWVEVE